MNVFNLIDELDEINNELYLKSYLEQEKHKKIKFVKKDTSYYKSDKLIKYYENIDILNDLYDSTRLVNIMIIISFLIGYVFIFQINNVFHLDIKYHIFVHILLFIISIDIVLFLYLKLKTIYPSVPFLPYHETIFLIVLLINNAKNGEIINFDNFIDENKHYIDFVRVVTLSKDDLLKDHYFFYYDHKHFIKYKTIKYIREKGNWVSDHSFEIYRKNHYFNKQIKVILVFFIFITAFIFLIDNMSKYIYNMWII